MNSDPVIKPCRTLSAIQKSEWDNLSSSDFPFADYTYLRTLEESGSVGPNTGWDPLYLTATSEDCIVGASYLYVKEHSYGEYIFDWAWVEAYQKYQVPYFPKLLSMIPFTPATGPTFLVAENVDRATVVAALISEALQQMESLNHSSLHYLFIRQDEIALFEKAGFLIRHSFQYHWAHQEYSNFNDFLKALKSRKRKQIAREREQIQHAKLSFRTLTGDALTADHAALFYRFYLSTIAKMGAYPYLTERFFADVFDSMRNQIVLFLADDETETVAASLCYAKGDTLYGRYWGASREIKNLHFELCYYQPIEWAIARGLRRFEAGAQGEHKFARGFSPTLTYSAHWIRHPGFREAISRFIDEEKLAIHALFESMRGHSAYSLESDLEGNAKPA